MTPLLSKIYTNESNISPSQAQNLLVSWMENKFTGVVRLAYEQDERIFILFKQGVAINAYQVTFEETFNISQNWLDVISTHKNAFISLTPLSQKTLLFIKILIESSKTGIQTTEDEQGFRKIVDNAGHNTAPELIYFLNENSEGCLFSCNNPLEIHSLFFEPEKIVDESAISEPIHDLLDSPEKQKVWKYNPAADIPAWQEYYLRCASGRIINESLIRYESITGRSMADSASRIIVVNASHNKRDITMVSRHVVDNDVFANPAEVSSVYKKLLIILMDQITNVIGNRLTESIMTDAVSALRPAELRVARAFDLFSTQYISPSQNKELLNG